MYARTLLEDGSCADFEFDVEPSSVTPEIRKAAKAAIHKETGVPPHQQVTKFCADSTNLRNIKKLVLSPHVELTPAPAHERARLDENFPEIFQQSVIHVRRIGDWAPGDLSIPENNFVHTRYDIKNAGTFLQALYRDLNSPRTVDARMLNRFPSFRDGIKQVVSLNGFLKEVAPAASDSPQVTPVELECYDNIFRNIMAGVSNFDLRQFDSPAADSLFFGSTMILPPFFWDNHQSLQKLEMAADRGSGLRVFVRSGHQPDIYKFAPRSDLIVIDKSSSLPTLICEVDSHARRKDLIRMILQGVVACRQWRYVLPELDQEKNMLLGIFVEHSFVVELYYFHADNNYKVDIFQERFFLERREDALRLARIFFNYREKSLDIVGRSEKEKVATLERLVSESTNLPSFTTKKTPPASASRRSKQPTLPTIPETHTAALLLSAEVQSLLCPDGTYLQGTTHENVAAVKTAEYPFKTLGFIKLTNRSELHVFDTIRNSGSEFLLSHVVLPTKVVEVSGYSIVFLPYGGEPLLYSWGLPGAPFGHEIRIAWDLLAIISQLHDLHIAHLDVKPTNILWDSSSKSVRVIDFDSSVKLDSNGGRIVKGVIGTSGYAAPEVESEEGLEYDPFLADAFSCGQVLWEILLAETMSEERRFVLDLARALRKGDASERWSISQAKGAWIDWIKKCGENSMRINRSTDDNSLFSSSLPASVVCVH